MVKLAHVLAVLQAWPRFLDFFLKQSSFFHIPTAVQDSLKYFLKAIKNSTFVLSSKTGIKAGSEGHKCNNSVLATSPTIPCRLALAEIRTGYPRA